MVCGGPRSSFTRPAVSLSLWILCLLTSEAQDVCHGVPPRRPVRKVLGGLQGAAPEGWIEAPPLPGTLVCNIGDMLDRMTGGWYRSTPHRVRNLSGHGRLSFPFFLDPVFSAEVPPLPERAAAGDDGRRRWDGQDLRAFTGTYGDYLLGKVSKVFPQLRRDVLD